MKKLTAAEEQIMQTLWSLERYSGTMANTKPHYNFVGTLLNILPSN